MICLHLGIQVIIISKLSILGIVEKSFPLIFTIWWERCIYKWLWEHRAGKNKFFKEEIKESVP